jgi:hypothetical protein
MIWATPLSCGAITSDESATLADMQLDPLIGPARARRLRAVLLESLGEAYNENCERFSETLGDNNVTFGVAVTHNLRHLLEEALLAEPGFQTSRPRGSFEIQIDGAVALHLYKAKRGINGPEMIRLDDSQTKIELVTKNQNADQLALSFDDPVEEIVRSGVRQLLVLHIGDHDDGFDTAYIGAPSYSPVNGFRWVWLESLDGSEEVERFDVTPPALDEDVVFGDRDLPDLEVELLEDATDDQSDQEAG